MPNWVQNSLKSACCPQELRGTLFLLLFIWDFVFVKRRESAETTGGAFCEPAAGPCGAAPPGCSLVSAVFLGHSGVWVLVASLCMKVTDFS